MYRLVLFIGAAFLLVGPLDNANANIIEGGSSSAFQIFQHTRANDGNWNDRPRRDQKSLLIVFDTTNSMAKDLAQLKGGAQDIVNNFASRSDQPIYNYVLSLFNDPSKFK